MDRDKILAAIAQNEAVIDDPTTPEDMRASLRAATEQARAQLAEHERDPHGQKRIVDDCHVLLVEIRDSISGFRDMALAGADIRVGRQIAEHGALVHGNIIPTAAEQTFEDNFVVYDYQTRYFNEMPAAVALFNRLTQAQGAAAFKPLFMAVARDCDRVLEVLHLARKEAIDVHLLRSANQDALRAAFFLNPLVINLTDYSVSINDWFPFFLVDAMTEIAASWDQKPAEPVIVVVEEAPNGGTATVVEEVMEKGGTTAAGEKIQVTIKGKQMNLDINAYRNAQKEIHDLQKSEGLLHEQAHWMDKNKRFVKEEYKKRIHFAEGTTEDQKEMVLDHLVVDTLMKGAGHKGLFKKGGKITFRDKVEAIAKNLEGKPVPKKYQKTEGKRFTKKTAHAAAERIAGKVVSREKVKAAKKMLLGGTVIHAPGNMHLMNLDNLDIHSVGGASVI